MGFRIRVFWFFEMGDIVIYLCVDGCDLVEKDKSLMWKRRG